MFLQTRSSAAGSLIQHCIDIANELDFPTTHPFRNGLFGPIISWVLEERDLLQRMKTENLDKSDLEKAWKLLTVDLREYRRGIRAGYLTYVRETYQKAGLLPPQI